MEQSNENVKCLGGCGRTVKGNPYVFCGSGTCRDDWYKKELQVEEYKKCMENPYYFATTYLTVNGENYTTDLTEESFNEFVKELL